MEFKRAVVEVFGGCNYSCKMCPQSISGRETGFLRKMPFELFEKILDQLTGDPLINLEGSGEPTLVPDLPRYIQACTDRGFRSAIYSNGTGMHGEYMRQCVDAGLSIYRFSCIGYTPELYKKWMSQDRFEEIREYAKQMREYAPDNVEISSYHLIIDLDNTEHEIEQYRKNFIDYCRVTGYIWKMHNWSGNWSPEYARHGDIRRSCGRPFAQEITIRAGGNSGLQGAVTPCCQTMGAPNESLSVLGHAETTSLEDIYYGDAYNKLRKDHEMGEWPSYCENCDFLIDDPETLIWSNDSEAARGRMLGVDNIGIEQ